MGSLGCRSVPTLTQRTFPSDQAVQRELLGPAEHPAANNLHLVRSLLAELTAEGELVLDPMAGTGSTGLLAALSGRNALCVDCERRNVDAGAARWNELRQQMSMLPYGTFEYVHGDAGEYRAPQMADAIIFSPPFVDSLPSDGRDGAYWDAFFAEKSRRDGRAYNGTRRAFSRTYGTSERNIGGIRSYEAYGAAMERVFARCAENLDIGGRIAVIVRDVIRDGAVTPLVADTAAWLEVAGEFAVEEEWRRPLRQLGLWTRVRQNKGEPVIVEESVLIGSRILS